MFPALIHHPAWKRVCVKNVFFCVSSRLKSVVVFLAQAHPNRCFCQKLFTFRDQKPRKRYAAGKTELPKITSRATQAPKMKVIAIACNSCTTRKITNNNNNNKNQTTRKTGSHQGHQSTPVFVSTTERKLHNVHAGSKQSRAQILMRTHANELNSRPVPVLRPLKTRKPWSSTPVAHPCRYQTTSFSYMICKLNQSLLQRPHPEA